VKVTVLHTTNTRNASFNALEQTVTDLLDGKFYFAGTVEAETADDALDLAWQWTQNDYHNMVLDKNPIHPETGKPLPIRWNGKFAQRSSMVGDVFLVGDTVYVVASTGFEDLNPLGALGAAAAIALSSSSNPYDDGRDGWPEDGRVFNSMFDALMTG
jgi:hypothetical protein